MYEISWLDLGGHGGSSSFTFPSTII